MLKGLYSSYLSSRIFLCNFWKCFDVYHRSSLRLECSGSVTSICVLAFGPDKLYPFVLWLQLMLVFHFMGQIQSLDACVQFPLTSIICPFYLVFLPDAPRFSVTVLPKQCLLLISHGLNKLKMHQILFMFTPTQHLSLAVNMWKLDTCFSMPEVFMSHPCSYNLFNLCKVWLH